MSMKSEDLRAKVVGNGELSELLGLNPASISRLAQDGTLRKVSRGKYRLGDALADYIAHLKKGSETPLSGLDEEEQRVRIEERKLKVAKAKAEVGRIEEMRRDNFKRGRAIQDLIVQAPARVAPKGAVTLGVDVAPLRAWLDEVHHRLALDCVEAAKGIRDLPDDRPEEDAGTDAE